MQTSNTSTRPAKSNAVSVLWQHGVHISNIAKRCGKTHDTVNRALGLETCGRTTLRNLMIVRNAAEELLTESGYQEGFDAFWDEYDNQFKEVA